MDPMLLEMLKGMKSDISEMRETQQRQGDILTRVEIGYGEHHNRSLYNESVAKTAREDALAAREYSRKMFESLQSEINPIKAHVAAWGGVAKALAIVGTLAAIAAPIIGLIKLLSH